MSPEKLRRSISSCFGVSVKQISDSQGSVARASLYGQTLCSVEIESVPVSGYFRYMVKKSVYDGFGGADIQKSFTDFERSSPDATLKTWVTYSTLVQLRALLKKALST